VIVSFIGMGPVGIYGTPERPEMEIVSPGPRFAGIMKKARFPEPVSISPLSVVVAIGVPFLYWPVDWTVTVLPETLCTVKLIHAVFLNSVICGISVNPGIFEFHEAET